MIFRFLAGVFFCLTLHLSSAVAQEKYQKVIPLKLSDSLRAGSREFSGLAVLDQRLFLLCENRNDHLSKPTRGVYSIGFSEIERCLSDTNAQVEKFVYHAFSQLDFLAAKLPGYQGLESIAFEGNRFFLTVETSIDTDDCYLLTGLFENDIFQLDTSRIVSLKKPNLPDGSHVFNAGYESLVTYRKDLIAFYEYNSHPRNFAISINLEKFTQKRIQFEKIPFRITDMTRWRRNRYLAINYFFPLKAEAIYHQGISKSDSLLVHDNSGKLRPFARLISFRFGRKKVKMKEIFSLPQLYWTSNWEGIARYGSGVLLINDKFTKGGRPESQLIFVDLKRQ